MKRNTRMSFCCSLIVLACCIGLAACSPDPTTTITTTKSSTVQTTTSTTTATTSPTTTATAKPTAAPSATTTARDLPSSFPLLDSSTARIPITAALYGLFVRQYGVPGPEPICSKTHQAWLNLADGTVDLILCIAPTAEEQAYLNAKDVDVAMRLYGCDGLVFLGNADNPVQDLTQDQVKGIYRGEIVNWSQLGGPDQKINAYYRDDQSGSQRFFETLVWKDEEIPDFGSLDLILSDEMSDITYSVISDPYAIGFNIMSYVDMAFSDPKLMLFAIDGIAPSTETLADARYAYITQAYVIINADEPANSPARWLFDWFGCEISRELIANNSSLSVIFGDPVILKAEKK
jgi:phosphate transport system substrate-binding protein